MSSKPNDFVEGDDDTAMDASLLISSKYRRLWRLSLYIRIFISLIRTRTTTATRESEQLSHDTPLPSSSSLPTLLIASKYRRLWRRSLYIRIFISLTRTRTTTATRESEQLSHYTPLPSSSSLPTRTSSSKSSCTINVASDNEEELEQRIKNDIARIVKAKDLESLRELGGVDRVRSVLSRRQSEVYISSTRT